MNNNFVKRVEQIQTILKHLERGSWCGVIAPDHSGKTILANQLVAAIREKHPNCQVTHVEFNSSATLEGAWRQVEKSMSIPRIGDSNSMVKMADLLVEMLLANTNTRHCFVLDNLDALPDEVLRLFAAELRRVRNNTAIQPYLSCTLLGATKLRYLTAGPYSPLSNVLEIIDLPDLASDQAVQVLSSYFNNISLDADTQNILYAETAGHPYLVKVIAENLCDSVTEPSAKEIVEVATAWSLEDDCFLQSINYIEQNRRVFEIVLQLLEGEKALPTTPQTEVLAMMCGGLSLSNGVIKLRGRMFQRALAGYMDDLRKGDYWCIHGSWERAEAYYNQVPSKKIRERRTKDMGRSKRQIVDLYLELTPQSLRLRTLAEVEGFIAKSCHKLFGADDAALWRLEEDFDDAMLVFSTSADSQSLEDYADITAAAIRNYRSSVLRGNKGVVQGLGGTLARTQWGISLHYTDGLPAAQWVEKSLRYAEPSLFLILDQVRQREQQTLQQKAQLSLIHEIALSIQQAKSVDEVFTLILTGIKEQLDYECAQLSLFFPEEKLIRAVKANGAFSDIIELTVRDQEGEDILAIVVRNAESKIIEDCEQPEANCDPVAIEKSEIKSQVVVPLITDNKAIGTLQVGDTKRIDAFRETDAELLQLLADQAAIAIQMAEEREILKLALEASGDAMVVIDASNRVTSRNNTYANLSVSHEPSSLIQLAFERKQSVQTIQKINNRNYIVTAASRKDSFNRYAGGVEVISTQGPLYGLTETLSKMLALTNENELGQAIVDCVCEYLGYQRARFYRFNSAETRLKSRYSKGMSEDITIRFANGEFAYELDSDQLPNDQSEILRNATPVIKVRKEYAEASLPLRSITIDSQSRRTFVLEDEDIPFLEELGKNDVEEWIEIPLKATNKLIGMLSIDQKGSNRSKTEARFGLEDLELMALFGRWAADAMARVIELEHEKLKANIVQEARLIGKNKDINAVVWDFLLHITLEQGLGFNRAAVFLKSSQNEIVTGFLCHGAGTKAKWEAEEGGLPMSGDRQELIQDLLKQKLEGNFSDAEQLRIDALCTMRIENYDTDNPFSKALVTKKTVFEEKANINLSLFYQQLAWEPAATALICPLVFRDECEGLLYVDKAFLFEDITDLDSSLLDSLSIDLAVAARVHRIVEQQTHQVLAGLAHAGISPLTAIHGLAESLRDTYHSGKIHEQFLDFIDIIIAESQRCTDVIRRVIRAVEFSSEKPIPKLEKIELCKLLRERVKPYETLFSINNIDYQIEVSRQPIWALADPSLLGSVFAELAANSFLAIKATTEPTQEKRFRVYCHMHDQTEYCEIIFENSGEKIPPSLQSEIFKPYYSKSGSTGIGLWIVKLIIEAHDGTINVNSGENGILKFAINLPLTQKYEEE